jgi:RNA 3'-terminal phosphate cyclase (ATP)
MKTFEIDGSFGEGGGQILRTALSLSCITGTALKLVNIRKGRKKPGLMPQHITCVNAAALISGAEVSGNERGSSELMFIPVRVKPGDYTFDIQTAGSSALVFQTLLPPLIYAGKTSNITIKGGTHVPFSPTYHYISEVFLPMLKRIGVKAEPVIRRYGFYPKGGGEVSFIIHPSKTIESLKLIEKGHLLSLSGCSAVSRLPLTIAERQKESAERNLAPPGAVIQVMDVPSHGPGTFIFLKSEYEYVLAGFSSLGEKGRPAEDVGKEAAGQCMAFYNASACLDTWLADQIVLYLCLARDHSSFTASRITKHLLTNLWVIKKFLDVRYEVEGKIDEAGRVKLMPEAK